MAPASAARRSPVARAGAMAAHVVEGAQRAIGMAQDQDRAAGDFGHHVVAGVGKFAAMRGELPAAAEHQLALVGQALRIGVVAHGQGARLVLEFVEKSHAAEVSRRLRCRHAQRGHATTSVTLLCRGARR